MSRSWMCGTRSYTRPCLMLRWGWRVGRCRASNLCFLLLPFGAVCQQVVGIARAHDPRPSERQRNAGGVDRDPTSTPMLGYVGRGPRATGGVQHQVAGVCGHQDAALQDIAGSLYNIYLCLAKASGSHIVPVVRDSNDRVVIAIHAVTDVFSHDTESIRSIQAIEAILRGSPEVSTKCVEFSPIMIIYEIRSIAATIGIDARRHEASMVFRN